ncbi:hypothetical protein [Zoogloea sp.]|uniref:hypothetical protein n=1 Tax=Zoogloea sp. TaxID=49181 RepID=UPI00261E1B4C|nr:hypothetical protein [Zoogloea sp.]MDD3354940.1 hypothetical protein [Zoogloea sp.]
MILPAIVILLALGSFGWLLASQDGPAQRAARALDAERRSAQALQIAREALLGFAANYRNSEHPNADFGYLPCPDLNGDGSSETCGRQGHTSVGRLPYLTLNLPDLRDGGGECLWYAVAGSMKNNPKAAAVNWDSKGRFRLLDENRQPRALRGDQDGLAVAVVIAPGRPNGEQQRSPGPGRCGGDPEARQLEHYLETLASTHATDVIEVQPPSDRNNDRVATITTGDIYTRLKLRPSYTRHLQRVFEAVAACLDATNLPPPVGNARHGPVQLGRLPAADSLRGTCRQEDLRDATGNWLPMMRYARCINGRDCLAGGNRRCRGALLFAGEPLGGTRPQRRDGSADSQAIEQYLEAPTLAALTAGELTGLPERILLSPPHSTTDVALCLP